MTAFCSRVLGWALVAAALAGFVHDARLGVRARLGEMLDSLGGAVPSLAPFLPSPLSLISEIPTWPASLIVGVALVSLAGRLQASYRAHEGAPVATEGVAPATTEGDGQRGKELRSAIGSVKGALVSVAAFSGVSNLLMLTGSFFMLEVYDRVLPSRSLPTLFAIAILATVLFSIQGLLDLTRARLLSRVGVALDDRLSARVYDAVVRLPLRTQMRGDGQQPVRDLDSLRAFLSGNGLPAFFDLPWMPLYLFVIYIFHPVLGMTALGGVIFLVVVTLLTEVMSARPSRLAAEHGLHRNMLGEAGRRNAEVLAAMGMASALQQRWSRANSHFVAAQCQASDVTNGFGSLSRVFRMMLQSAVLAVGAYLVIKGEASAGIIIAGSILASRALAPVEMVVANWRGFVAARQSWGRLSKLFQVLPPLDAPMALPPPRQMLTVEALTAGAPGDQRAIIQDVAFGLRAGQGLAIMGPSASGKSTLARTLVGVWRPMRGAVRLDGATLDQWSTAALGSHIGYLPQDVELFAGTVAENIARFDPHATPEAIVAAAKTAGVHDLIVGLKDGYDTQIGDDGKALSAGQKQRIALARALYGDPFLVVLDEPNSNLDAEGDAALTQAIGSVRERGGIVVVVAHRPSAIAGLNMVLALHLGRQQIFGPKDEVLAKILRPAAAPSSQGAPGPSSVLRPLMAPAGGTEKARG